MNGNTKFGGYNTWINLSDVLPDGSMDQTVAQIRLVLHNPVALLNQTDNKSAVKRVLGISRLTIDSRSYPILGPM